MRKTLLILIALIFTLNCFSQTFQPTKQMLHYDNNLMFLDTNQDFKQNKWTLGWHWDNGFKMSQALNVDEIMFRSGGGNEVIMYRDTVDSIPRMHYYISRISYQHPDSIPRLAHNANLVIRSPYLSPHWILNGWNIAANATMEYEPTYHVNLSNPTANWSPRPNDTTGYAFGFGYVRGYISDSPSDLNYNRLQLFNQDSIRNQIVLKDPWVCNDLSTTIQCDTAPPFNIKSVPVIYNIYNRHVDSIPYSWDSVALNHLFPPRERLYPVEWKGVNFYLSINVRRLNQSDNLLNQNKPFDTVLVIKLPYVTQCRGTYQDSTGWPTDTTRRRGLIKFDSIPYWNFQAKYNLPNGRGLIRNMIGRKGDTAIYITRDMIPRGADNPRDITISAFFVCDNDTNIFRGNHNRGLKGYQGSNVFPGANPWELIDSLQITVEYRGGNMDVGIDWIKIETRPARELAMGYFDNTIISKMQEDLDSLTTTRYRNDSIQPYRWYLVDEPSSQYWFTRHYMTKLVGPVFTFEGGAAIPNTLDSRFQWAYPQYRYYCKPSENWFGMGGILGNFTTPYIQRHTPPTYYTGSDYNKNFGWSWTACYDFPYPHSWPYDQLVPFPDTTVPARIFRMKNSDYETVNARYFNFYKDINFDFRRPNWYFNNYGNGVLLDIERNNQALFDGNNSLNGFLYDSIPWWGQIWNDQRFAFYPHNVLNSHYLTDRARILDAAEFRYFMYKDILLSAKGFIMDGEAEYQDTAFADFQLHHGQKLIDSLPFLWLDSLPAWAFLDSQQIGGDFLSLTDPNELFRNYIEIDTIARHLNINRDRYYVGRRSIRREFKKISDWIKKPSVESTLMDLRLVAGLSKGFQRYYTQNPTYSQDIMNQYIKTNEILTRPLSYDRFYPYYENECKEITHPFQTIDSSFYDITLLKRSGEQNMDTCFYIGVLNKRTGPHILLDSADARGNQDSIVFITAAELDDSIAANPTKWEKYYHKRLGEREITLFFNDTTFQPTLGPDGALYKYLVITELGNTINDSAGYYLWPFWKRDYFDNRIDKHLYPNQPLKVNLLPGEGKILKVQTFNYLVPDTLDLTPPITCDCDAVLAKDNLTFRRNIDCDDTTCLSMEFDLYPCPNTTITSFSLILDSIPDCFKQFYNISLSRDGVDISDTLDMRDHTSPDTLLLPTGPILPNHPRTHLAFTFCPNALVNPHPEICSASDLMGIKAKAYFIAFNCEKELKVRVQTRRCDIQPPDTTSIKYFDRDINKFSDPKYNDFSIVPNPATDQIQIRFTQAILQESKLMIFDIKGNVLQKIDLQPIDANIDFAINTRNLSNGSYYLGVYNQGALIKGKQFIISR